MKYTNNIHATFLGEGEALATHLPLPHITLPRQTIESFRRSLDELIMFAAWLTGTTKEGLCSYDLMKFQHDYRQMQEKLADYDRVILKYAEIPPVEKFSHSPGYDPQSGFRDFSHTWTEDQYREARQVWLKWHPEGLVKKK